MENYISSTSLASRNSFSILENFHPKIEPDGRDCRVIIFGAGYVGCVSAGCLSQDGFAVLAVDPDWFKVECPAEGQAPIVEPGLSDLLSYVHKTDLLTATRSAAEAINTSDISFCCVGTPSLVDGTLNTDHVRQVCENSDEALRHKVAFHILVMRSTILPVTMKELVIPILERASRKTAERDFGVVSYPEFLGEITAIADYYKPGAIVLGQYEGDTRSIDALKVLVSHTCGSNNLRCVRTSRKRRARASVWHSVSIRLRPHSRLRA